MHHQNGLDLRMNYFTALSLKKDDNDMVHLNFRKIEKANLMKKFNLITKTI